MDSGSTNGVRGDRPVPRPKERTFRLGRAAFIALGAAGAGALFLGNRGGSGFNFAPGAASAEGFTIYTVTDGYPRFDSQAFRFTVNGMVARRLDFSMADILKMPAVREKRFYQCVTGWTVPDATWTGVRLSHLLDLAGPLPSAAAITFYSFDGIYTESLTMEQARKSDVLLAYKLMDKPLSRSQGAPLRLVVPGMYGYKFIKWVNRIELVSKPIDGYWENNGYDRDAYIGRSNGA